MVTEAASPAGCPKCLARIAAVRRGTLPDDDPGHCGTCHREPVNGKHPCRFEVACSCWRGIPCDGSGKVGRR